MSETMQKIERAHAVVSELCKGEREWIMNIPARPDHDPDLIISDALRAAKAEIARLTRELEEARGRERALRDDLTAAIGHLAALVDLYRDGYPESDYAARLVSAAEQYLESPSREQDVPSALAARTKHTPGPWIRDEDNPLCIGTPKPWYPRQVYHIVARLEGGKEYTALANATAEANARLIAAAPEMLEALRAIRRAFVTDHGALNQTQIEAIRLLDALERRIDESDE